ARLFASQDRGRRRPDGLIEFVGRNDRQIKLRGFRVELDEIEAAFVACPGVQNAAVVVRRDTSGLPQSLAAYVETKLENPRLRARDLRSVLAKALPFYTIPATINLIDELPRLADLKIDRIGLTEI